MLSRQIIVSIMFGLFLSLSVHSQAVCNNAPTLGPVIRAYYDALKKKDDAAVSRVLSTRFLAILKKDMKDEGKKHIAAFLAEVDYRKDMQPIDVKDEVLVGDNGAALVKGSFYKSWTPIGFVKENGTWRLSGENPDEKLMLRLPRQLN